MRKTVFTGIAVCMAAAIFLSASATNLAAKEKARLSGAHPDSHYPQIKHSSLMEDLQTFLQTKKNLTTK